MLTSAIDVQADREQLTQAKLVISLTVILSFIRRVIKDGIVPKYLGFS